MWAHYANNALGFVIEFEDLENTYPGDETRILSEIKCIKYKNKRSGVTFEKGSYNSLFIEKNKDWEYESEKRIVAALNDCVEYNAGNEVIYIQTINKKYISKVIFGWKVPESTLHRMSKEVCLINPGVNIAISGIEDGLVTIAN